MRGLLAFAFGALLALPLAAETVLRPEDQARLDNYALSFGEAMMEALAAGRPQDVSALTTALSGWPDIAFDESLTGEWSCRTIRLGGPAPLTVYAPFKCHFEIAGGGFAFEKRSGSERTRGVIQLRSGRAIYLGVGFAAGVNPPQYADLAADFVSDDQIYTHVALFQRVSANRARLLFPAPAGPGAFDILELTR